MASESTVNPWIVTVEGEEDAMARKEAEEMNNDVSFGPDLALKGMSMAPQPSPEDTYSMTRAMPVAFHWRPELALPV